MNKDYKKIFDSLSDKEEKLDLHVNSRILIIDSLNTFLRAFTVIRHLNKSGNHIGGLTGFLRSVSYAMNLVKPTRVILVFDGHGGSTNKRYIYPEYKANRGINRVTNWDMFESQQDESESITMQIVRLVEYLKCLPVDMLSIDKIEADDVIGYIAKNIGDNVCIMSSDRDYLQLVSNKITVFSPTKKKFYDNKSVTKEYGVTPQNFLTQKILLGDHGDNVPGVKGLGSKTMLKLFPELGGEDEVSLEQLIEKCKKENKKMHESILNFEYQLHLNKKLMDLHEPNIPEEALEEINNLILNPNRELNSQEFIKLYHEDDLGNSINNLQAWLFNNFNHLKLIK
jgi:DNA polymerase-1